MRRAIARASALLALGVLASPTNAFAQVAVRTALPAWVRPVAVPDAPAHVEGDVVQLLLDRQVHLEDGSTEWHDHRAYQLVNATGVQRGSEIEVEFGVEDAVVFHFVRRTRSGATEDLLPNLQFRVIQPESRRGHDIYDEHRSAILVLPDVRAGDTIDYAYTITSRESALAGHHAGGAPLGEAVRHAHFRLEWPAGSHVLCRTFDVPDSWTRHESDTSVEIDATDVESVFAAATHARGMPRVRWSDFAHWSDVVAWALPRYRREPARSAAFDAIVRSMQQAPSREQAARIAVRFVQDEVRYLGLEAGADAVVPHASDVVLERRYGDCKDKTALLVDLLVAAGFEADAALVDTLGTRLDEDLPSPASFDHAIVVLALDGHDVWIDPTVTFERGPLSNATSPPYRRALRIHAGLEALVPIPVVEPAAPMRTVEEAYSAAADGTGRLAVTTEFRDRLANAIRGELSTMTRDEYARERLEFYRRTIEGVTSAAAIRIDDDVDHNVVRVSESYRIPRFWVGEERSFETWLAANYANAPAADTLDERDYHPPYPLFVRHSIIIEKPDGWVGSDDETAHVESEDLSFSRLLRAEGRRYRIESTLRFRSDRVPQERMAAFRRDVERVREESGRTMFEHTRESEAVKRDRAAAKVLFGVIGVVLIVVVLGSWVKRFVGGRRGRKFRAKQKLTRGEAPDSAVPVESVADALKTLERMRCCDRESVGEPSWTQLRFGGETLSLSTRRCSACNAVEKRYFRIPIPNEPKRAAS